VTYCETYTSSFIVLDVEREIYKWSDEDVKLMALWGNERANAFDHLSLKTEVLGIGTRHLKGR
jgi:hypothetical protein